MSIAKVIEISSTSSEGFEDAIQKGIARVRETVAQVRGAWVAEQHVEIDEDGRISSYRVNLRVTFVLQDREPV